MAVSVFLITVMGVVATLRFVEPLLGPYDPSLAMEDLSDEGQLEPLTRTEKLGLAWAALSVLFFLGWMGLFYVWVFGFGLPVGPGAPTYFTP